MSQKKTKLQYFRVNALSNQIAIERLKARTRAYARRLTQLHPDTPRLVATSYGLVLFEVAYTPLLNEAEIDEIIRRFFCNSGDGHQT